jgi:hypothetical protein
MIRRLDFILDLKLEYVMNRQEVNAGKGEIGS